MALSAYSYVGTGSPQEITVPPYIRRSHIVVTVDDEPFTTYTYVNDQTISLTAPAGADIVVRRSTPMATQLVNFQAPVRATDLNTNAKQALYLIQELTDGGVSVSPGPGGGGGGPVGELSGPDGANQVGFDYSFSYAAGSIGRWLKDLALGAGATLIGFLLAVAGAQARTVDAKLQEHISSYDFLTPAQLADVKDRTAAVDCTAALQAFFNACKWNRGVLAPGKYRISASLTLDPTASYHITGVGFDINANLGSAILNVANVPAIVVDNAGTSNFNPDMLLERFAISGNNAGNNQHGIYARRTPINLKEIYTANCQHGIWLENGYTSKLENCISAQNYQHGFYLDKLANQIVLDHCIGNANSRNGGGFAGFGIQGTAGFENLAITLIGCDATSNGFGAGAPVGGTGSGVIVQHTRGISLVSHYSEINKTFGLYADNSVFNLVCQGGFFFDEEVRLLAVRSLDFSNNRLEGATAGRSRLRVQSSGGGMTRTAGNTYGGPAGVTREFLNGAGEANFRYDTAPPLAAGEVPWQTGDITWHTSPAVGGNVGWVCIAGGPSGLWRPFGTIS